MVGTGQGGHLLVYCVLLLYFSAFCPADCYTEISQTAWYFGMITWPLSHWIPVLSGLHLCWEHVRCMGCQQLCRIYWLFFDCEWIEKLSLLQYHLCICKQNASWRMHGLSFIRCWWLWRKSWHYQIKRKDHRRNYTWEENGEWVSLLIHGV